MESRGRGRPHLGRSRRDNARRAERTSGGLLQRDCLFAGRPIPCDFLLAARRDLGRGLRARAEEEEFKLFLAIFKDPGGGKSALKAYRDYLSAKGRLDPEIPTGLGPDALKGEDPYQGKIVIVLKGIYLLGAAGFQSAENGESHLKAFMKKVK